MRRPPVLSTACLVSLTLVACGPERGDGDTGVFGELCGEAAPRQVVALEPNEIVHGSGVARDGDRWMVSIVSYAEDVTTFLHEHDGPGSFHWTPDDFGLTRVGARIVSIDACGGEPRVVAEDLDHIDAPVRGRGPWVGRNEEGLYAFDPHGAIPPRFLGKPDLNRYARAGEDVLLAEGGTLIRKRIDGDRVVSETLLPDVVMWSDLPSWHEWVPREVLAVHRDDGLVAVDLETRAVEVLRQDATWAVLQWGAETERARFVVWGDGEMWENPRLFDRERDLDVVMGEHGRYSFPPATALAHVAFVTIWDDERRVDRTHIITLPDLHEHWLDGSWHPYVETWRGNIVFESSAFPAGTGGYVMRHEEGEPRRVVEGIWRSVHVRGDALQFHFINENREGDEWTKNVYRLGRPADDPDLVAEDVPGWSLELGGGYWATVTGWLDGYARLALLDTATGHSSPVADHVHPQLSTYRVAPWLPSSRDAPFVYSVRDPSHERTGLWQLVPPAP